MLFFSLFFVLPMTAWATFMYVLICMYGSHSESKSSTTGMYNISLFQMYPIRTLVLIRSWHFLLFLYLSFIHSNSASVSLSPQL